MQNITVNYRKHRTSVNHPSFSPSSSQVIRSEQSVTPSGASVAIRPPKTAIRQMNNAGTGSIGYF